MTASPDSSTPTEARPQPEMRAPLIRLFEWRAAHPFVFGCVAGAIFPLFGLGARFLLLGGETQFPYISFYPAVCMAALLAGLNGGIVGALVSVVLAQAFVTPAGAGPDVPALAIFLSSTLLVALLAEYMHRIQARAMQRDALAAAQRSLSQIVETSMEAIYSIDRDGRVATWNAGAERLYGYTAAEMIGRSVARLTPRDMQDDLLKLRDHAQRGEPVVDFETTRRRKDGNLVRVAITASPIRDGDELSGMSIIARDITDRKQAEEALRAALLRVQAKFENAAVGMADVADDGAWLRVNGKLCSMLGYTHAELMRMNFAEITHPEDLADDLEQVQRLLSGEAESFSMEKRYIRKDRSIIWTDLTVGVVRRPDGAFDHFLSIVQDISERKLAEERVKLLMNEVNHRANNLLAVVQSIAQQTAGSEDTKTYVANLRDRIQGLAASQRLLVENEWRGTNLRELVGAQLAMFADLIGKRILIDGPDARLTAAATQGIGLALHELATNAAKYGALSSSVGRVRIEWEIEGPDFRLRWREEGGPEVAPPTRMGFGQAVIGRMAEAAVEGRATIEYPAAGVCWTLVGRSAVVLGETAPGPANPAATGKLAATGETPA